MELESVPVMYDSLLSYLDTFESDDWKLVEYSVCKTFSFSCSSFRSIITKNIAQSPNFYRLKHRILRFFVLNIKYVDEHSDSAVFFNIILEMLLRGMAVNHLVPVCSNLFQAIISKYGQLVGSDEAFYESTFLIIHRVMLTSNRFTQLKIVQKILPLLPKYHHYVAALPDFSLKNKYRSSMFSCVAFTSCLGGGTADELKVIFPLFSSFDADILHVIISHLSKLSPSDSIEYWRSIIPIVWVHQSTSFRQQFLLSMNQLLVQITKSTALALRNDNTSLALNNVKFVDWVFEFSLRNISHGGEYKCTRTYLGIVESVLRVFRMDNKMNHHVMNFAHSHGFCNFINDPAYKSILCCMLHCVEELQNISAGLIFNFYKKRLLNSISNGDKFAFLDLIEIGLNLCNGFRNADCSAGSTIVCHCFQILISQDLSLAISFDVFHNVNVKLVDSPAVPLTTCTSSLSITFANQDALLQQILSIITTSFSQCSENLLVAAKTTPIHGYLVLLRKILGFIKRDPVPLIITEIIRVSIAICNAVMIFFCDKCDSDRLNVTSRSFRDIHEAIYRHIALFSESGECIDETSLLLSDDFVLVLSWAFYCIRESLEMLSVFADKCAVSEEQSSALLTCFLNVLLKCRHKGVIGNGSASLYRLLGSIVRRKQSNLIVIALDKIIKAFSEIENSSVTRRAAGIPFIVLALLKAIRFEHAALVCFTIKRLFGIALLARTDNTTSLNYNELCDNSAVYALHCLKVIFADATLSALTHCLIEDCAIICLFLFRISKWDVNNAVLQLFSCITCKFFGQATSESDFICTSFSGFALSYPRLVAVILRILSHNSSYLERSQDDSKVIVATLEFLCRLRFTVRLSKISCTFLLSKFLLALLRMIGSSYYFIRTASSRAFANLMPPDQYYSWFEKITSLMSCITRHTLRPSLNIMHGLITLLGNISSLPEFSFSNLSDAVIHSFINLLLQCFDLSIDCSYAIRSVLPYCNNYQIFKRCSSVVSYFASQSQDLYALQIREPHLLLSSTSVHFLYLDLVNRLVENDANISIDPIAVASAVLFTGLFHGKSFDPRPIFYRSHLFLRDFLSFLIATLSKHLSYLDTVSSLIDQLLIQIPDNGDMFILEVSEETKRLFYKSSVARLYTFSFFQHRSSSSEAMIAWLLDVIADIRSSDSTRFKHIYIRAVRIALYRELFQTVSFETKFYLYKFVVISLLDSSDLTVQEAATELCFDICSSSHVTNVLNAIDNMTSWLFKDTSTVLSDSLLDVILLFGDVYTSASDTDRNSNASSLFLPDDDHPFDTYRHLLSLILQNVKTMRRPSNLDCTQDLANSTSRVSSTTNTRFLLSCINDIHCNCLSSATPIPVLKCILPPISSLSIAYKLSLLQATGMSIPHEDKFTCKTVRSFINMFLSDERTQS